MRQEQGGTLTPEQQQIAAEITDAIEQGKSQLQFGEAMKTSKT